MGQKNQMWWDLPAQESFRSNQEIYGIDDQQFRRRMDELISLLEVSQLISRPVRELSLGERMRMELIASLLHSPICCCSMNQRSAWMWSRKERCRSS